MDETQFRQIAAQLRKPEGEDGIKTGNVMNRGNLAMNLSAIEAIDVQSGDNILEIGMGNGYFVNHILSVDEKVTYTGYDYSDVMIAESEKNNRAWMDAGRAKFVFGNVAAMPFADNEFDKIFTVNTVYFWEDTRQVLDELKRVLKPEGMLVIALRPKRQMLQYPFTRYGFNMFSKEEISDLLNANGFAVVGVSENKEPDFEMEGHTLMMEHMIVIAAPQA